MIATLDNYQEPVRRIADEFIAANNRAKKPLYRFREYLDALEGCAEQLTKLLIKVEHLAVMTALICFLVWGIIDHFIRLHV